jgi:hypothetical protein
MADALPHFGEGIVIMNKDYSSTKAPPQLEPLPAVQP